MMTLQKQFLCALMFNAVSLSAMIAMGHDDTKILIEKLHDRVNIRHLNIGKYDCCKSIKSTIRSYYHTTWLPKEKAYSEIRTIQSYIPSELPLDDKKQIFSQLIKQHSYVHHLMQILVQHKYEQFINVEGSTIDSLYTPDFTNDINDLEKEIYTEAKQKFCRFLNIDSYIDSNGGYLLQRRSYENPDRLFLLYLCHRACENSRSQRRGQDALDNSNAMKQIQNR
jgi:hypothetical protein